MSFEKLRREGFQVDAVSSGQAALARLTSVDYDLILCDIRMPGMSGVDLYRQIQQRHRDQVQRLMFITGDTVSPATRRFLQETGAPCLGKPFAVAELMRKIPGMLNSCPHGCREV